jgi:membrane protease subunit HflC
MSKAKTGIIAGILAVVVVLLVIFGSAYTVNEGEYKVVLRFGEAVRINDNPGLKFKIPFIETTTTLSKKQMLYESGSASQILTKDKKPILVDNYTVWKISDVNAFLRTVRTELEGQKRIDETVFNTLRRKLSEVEYGHIISEDDPQRGNLNDEITQEVASTVEKNGYGITIIDVRIKKTDLPEENKESVYNRMISDRTAIAQQYLSEGDEASQEIKAKADADAQKEVANGERDAKIKISEGEAEAAKIYNNAYAKDPAFYSLYRTLESYKTTLVNEPVIMIPIDSPYARILMGQE